MGWTATPLLKELVRNLVDNAINYTPASDDRPGVVTVRVLADTFGRVLLLQVEDTGPGVPRPSASWSSSPSTARWAARPTAPAWACPSCGDRPPAPGRNQRGRRPARPDAQGLLVHGAVPRHAGRPGRLIRNRA